MKTIRSWHAHLYYDETTLEEAGALREKVGETFGIELGRLHEREVGPHPRWSCQLSVPHQRFGEIIPWLCQNRGNVDVFVHPNTGDDLWDHTQGIMWLGRSFELKTAMFQ